MTISINQITSKAIETENPNRIYVDFDKVRLVVEDNELVGWYDPEQKCCGCSEKDGAE